MEDVGRHNAVDKIAGYMFLNGIAPEGKIFYTDRPADQRDGDQDGADAHPDPDLALRLHRLGVDLARQANLTLIGRAKGKRFIALSAKSASCSTPTSTASPRSRAISSARRRSKTTPRKKIVPQKGSKESEPVHCALILNADNTPRCAVAMPNDSAARKRGWRCAGRETGDDERGWALC